MRLAAAIAVAGALQLAASFSTALLSDVPSWESIIASAGRIPAATAAVWNVVGNATFNAAAGNLPITLTSGALRSETSAAWCAAPVSLDAAGFLWIAEVQIIADLDCCGDGMTFTLQGAGSGALDVSGDATGFGYVGVTPSVAIALATTPASTVTVWTNGHIGTSAGDVFASTVPWWNGPLYTTISYSGPPAHRLTAVIAQVHLLGTYDQTFTWTVDVRALLGCGVGANATAPCLVFYGVTGATGTTATQWLELTHSAWASLSPTPSSTPTPSHSASGTASSSGGSSPSVTGSASQSQPPDSGAASTSTAELRFTATTPTDGNFEHGSASTSGAPVIPVAIGTVAAVVGVCLLALFAFLLLRRRRRRRTAHTVDGAAATAATPTSGASPTTASAKSPASGGIGARAGSPAIYVNTLMYRDHRIATGKGRAVNSAASVSSLVVGRAPKRQLVDPKGHGAVQQRVDRAPPPRPSAPPAPPLPSAPPEDPVEPSTPGLEAAANGPPLPPPPATALAPEPPGAHTPVPPPSRIAASEASPPPVKPAPPGPPTAPRSTQAPPIAEESS